jgi:hypothetical protein
MLVCSFFSNFLSFLLRNGSKGLVIHENPQGCSTSRDNSANLPTGKIEAASSNRPLVSSFPHVGEFISPTLKTYRLESKIRPEFFIGFLMMRLRARSIPADKRNGRGAAPRDQSNCTR